MSVPAQKEVRVTSGTWRWKPVWTWAGGIVLAALLGGGGAHWWSENEHRETLARTMAQDVGQVYVIGAEATIYPELRSFCQKHQEEGLQALRVLDTRRELLNQYPRDFEPRATGLEVPIRTPDGILRGYLVAHHGPIPPGVQLFWFLIILAAGMAGLALWQYRDAEVARKDAELMRINALSTAFRSILSREGGEVANATQAIEGYRLQLQASLYDIVHDATKVEILGGSGAEKLAGRLRHLPKLSDTQEGRLLPTIRSRCQRVGFRALEPQPMRAWFERHAVPEPDRAWLTEFSDGSPGTADLAHRRGLRA